MAQDKETKPKLICPFCEVKIDKLNLIENCYQETDITLDGTGKAISEDNQRHELVEEKATYHCPECRDEIADSEEKALEFLQGNWMGPDPTREDKTP